MDEPLSNPDGHAHDFALRWAEELDRYAAERMEALGIPAGRIGASDHRRRISWCAFNPHDRDGGGVSPDGRITVDSGVLNPELLKGSDAAGAWEHDRLRDRIDATIAHEFEEGNGRSHDEAIARSPDTELPIRQAARALARTISEARRSPGIPPADSSPLP